MIRRYILSVVAIFAAVCVKAEMPQASVDDFFRGDLVAQCDLALQYYEAGDYDNAFKWFKKSADAGNPSGLYYLGECYAKGRGVDQDLLEAVICIHGAAEKGLTKAQYELAYCYQKGIGVRKNTELARKWYKIAAENRHPMACYEYAVLCCDKNSREYCDYLSRAVAGGVVKAYFPYGVYWLEGPEVDDIEGLKFIRKAIAAGNPCAMTYMAHLYRYGRFVGEDVEEAFKLYCRASDGGCITGRYALAECYEEGIGTNIDTAKALELYQSISNYEPAKAKIDNLTQIIEKQNFDVYKNRMVNQVLGRFINVPIVINGRTVEYYDEYRGEMEKTNVSGGTSITKFPITIQEFEAIVNNIVSNDTTYKNFNRKEANDFFYEMIQYSSVFYPGWESLMDANELGVISIGEMTCLSRYDFAFWPLKTNSEGYVVGLPVDSGNDNGQLLGYMFLER